MIVRHTVSPWTLGGVVEQRHGNFDNLWGIRAKDGCLYWLWECDFRTECKDLFSDLYRLEVKR